MWIIQTGKERTDKVYTLLKKEKKNLSRRSNLLSNLQIERAYYISGRNDEEFNLHKHILITFINSKDTLNTQKPI